ncbi:MAG TPA: RluA family pseudouridine synthase [Opitutaceae bacterium]|nr:RluA family pseudouridine synthase [Opitutaceae bacterium]
MSNTYTVLPGVRRARADKILSIAFPEHSRVAFQRSFDAGLVRIGGKAITRDHSVAEGDVLEFSFPDLKPAALRAVEIPLEVIHEDRHLLAINKPAGMVVHPGAGTQEDTLVHALLAHCKGKLSGVGGVERPGIVHRLDRETSGLILVAKDDAAHRGLSEQFSGRTVQKEYLALVAGAPALLSGSIRKAIGRNQQHRHKMSVLEVEDGGRDAHTDWEVVERFGDLATLLRCTIHTGRTHQIRVHLKSLGHIILGDVVYGWKPDPRLPKPPERVMLHAEHIVFTHPVSGKTVDLRAPLPKDFESQLTQLRKAAKGAEKAGKLAATQAKSRQKAARPSYHAHESRK